MKHKTKVSDSQVTTNQVTTPSRKTDYTPGPYTFREHAAAFPEWDGAVGEILGLDGEYVAEIDGGVSPERAKANRALLLSAPTMVRQLAEHDATIEKYAQQARDYAAQLANVNKAHGDLVVRSQDLLMERNEQAARIERLEKALKKSETAILNLYGDPSPEQRAYHLKRYEFSNPHIAGAWNALDEARAALSGKAGET